jgi:hypothetical protein
MKRNKTLELIGFRYIVNHRTSEVHSLKNQHVNCNIKTMANTGYCTKIWALILIKYCGYNGCYWCNRKYDTG